MESSQWVMESNNMVEKQGESSLETLSLLTKLEQLWNLQLSLPEEELKCGLIRTLGDKVVPGSSEAVQAAVHAPINASAQEWQALQSFVVPPSRHSRPSCASGTSTS